MPIDNKRKDVLILGIGPTCGLDDTSWAAKAQYSIDISKPNK